MVTNQAAIDKWHEDDNLATYYLFNTCNKQQKQTFLTCATAHSIWTSLTSRFQQNTAERGHSLLQTFLTCTFNPNHCVRAHIEAVKLLAQQLCDAGGNVGDKGKCAGILASLPPSYDHFLTSSESTPIAERTLNLLTERLVRKEARSLRKNGGERSTEDKAFFGLSSRSQPQGPSRVYCSTREDTSSHPYQHSSGGSWGSHSRNTKYAYSTHGRSRSTGRCPFCHIVGHEERDCHYKKNGGIACGYCKIFGHEEKDCYSKHRNTGTGPLANSVTSSPRQGASGYVVGFPSVGRSRTDIYLGSLGVYWALLSTSLTSDGCFATF